MNRNHSELTELMIQAARNAGNYLKTAFRKGVKVELKGKIDTVTEADMKSEKIIIEALSKSGIPVAGEETFSGVPDSTYYFLVDPLDGTTNFSRRIPFYAVSIALMHKNEAVSGVIYLPEFDEIYVAESNKGACRINIDDGSEEEIFVSKTDKLSDSIIATGFPYDIWENFEDVISSMKGVLTKARAVRRFGSACIDLCYVASGIFDGYFEYRLKPWDTAAGFLIVKEAGGKVTDFSNREFNPFKNEICASNSLIHTALVEAINSR